MKKIAILTLSLLTLVAACDTKKEKESVSQEELMARQLDSLRNALSQVENESNDLMGTVEQIQEGFKQINEAEDIVTLQSKQGEGGDKATILENMALIQNKLKLNRELITSLQEQLRTSNSSNTKLKSTLEEMVKNFETQLEEKTKQIDELRAELEKRDVRIAEQDQQISALNENVNALSHSNEQKAQTIEQKTQAIAAQDKQMHTAYYVFGTKKELREQRILQHGDILKSSDFNHDYFTKIDYRVTKVIKLYSKKAELLTSHPAGTYSLDKDAQGQLTLRITDPDRFWSVNKYLVVEVK
ncbi:MAG: hypothetical protein IJ729_07685 [Alloprevotella sp.]|nr:hypothetical protein [Alloprevotella sp.]